MPVTAKLSLAFYEKLGEQVATELVDWFNAVDATYRADLRELNELNFARSDAKMEQRMSELGVKMERLEARLDARIDRLATALDGKLDGQVAAHAFATIEARFDRQKAELDAALQTGFRKQMGWMILMWITTIAALILRT
jgi:hypothetical protein